MIQVRMLSDKLLSRYGLLENFDAKKTHFEDVLDFDPKPHPWVWSLGSNVTERARWLSGRASDSGARDPGFELHDRRAESLTQEVVALSQHD